MASNKLQVSDFDFDDIKSNLKTFLQSQSEFQDYDFEGSGFAVLLDLLAYNTHYLGFNANMLANEMYLDSADIRKNIVSIAKMLGYTPTSSHCRYLMNVLKFTKLWDQKDKTIYNTVDVSKLYRLQNKHINSGEHYKFSLYEGILYAFKYTVDSRCWPKIYYTKCNADTTLKVSIQN